MNSGPDYRTTLMRELTAGIQRRMRGWMTPLAVGLGAISIALFAFGHKGAPAFALISAGTWIALAVWRRNGVGLPLLPMIAVQHLLLYGLPILVNRETMSRYPADFVDQAGVELLIFLLSLTFAWSGAMGVIRASFPVSHALVEYRRGGARKLRWICLALIVSSTGYQVLSRLGLLDPLLALLPTGADSIVWDLVAADATCGFFIGALLVGAGELAGLGRLAYWLAVAFNCYIAASSFLLSASSVFVISVVIGLFWSTGRIPWRFVAVAGLAFAFFNLGKDAMRDRYWRQVGNGNNIPDFTLARMPSLYSEWASVSFDLLTGNGGKIEGRWRKELGDAAAHQASQSLLDRINDLQNLLFAIDAVQRLNIEPLHGASYGVIPALLVPRILDPDKPRAHEGQVMLNVHFGRQDISATVDTYIAWGLLPEAYGNFGPWAGAAILGGVLGLLFAWLEKWTANKLVISLEGFVAFTVFLGFANSYEMVSSVLVTSIFQAAVPVAAATLPFVRRVVIRPGRGRTPEDAPAAAAGKSP